MLWTDLIQELPKTVAQLIVEGKFDEAKKELSCLLNNIHVEYVFKTVNYRLRAQPPEGFGSAIYMVVPRHFAQPSEQNSGSVGMAYYIGFFEIREGPEPSPSFEYSAQDKLLASFELQWGSLIRG